MSSRTFVFVAVMRRSLAYTLDPQSIHMIVYPFFVVDQALTTATVLPTLFFVTITSPGYVIDASGHRITALSPG